jgi:hypothetical protein
MGEQLGANILLQDTTPKMWTKRLPSSQELAEQYFHLQCLRQYVELAETSRTTEGKAPNSLRSSGAPS